MDQFSMLAQVILALVLGGILGRQRQQMGKWAGIRTYALVSGGSALFTVLSITSFGPDTARVAAGVVTGIGFLGAGTILHRENRVEGLTTAAGLWMVSAVGMAAGLQLYILAVIATLLALFVFVFDDKKITGNKNNADNDDDDDKMSL